MRRKTWEFTQNAFIPAMRMLEERSATCAAGFLSWATVADTAAIPAAPASHSRRFMKEHITRPEVLTRADGFHDRWRRREPIRPEWGPSEDSRNSAGSAKMCSFLLDRDPTGTSQSLSLGDRGIHTGVNGSSPFIPVSVCNRRFRLMRRLIALLGLALLMLPTPSVTSRARAFAATMHDTNFRRIVGIGDPSPIAGYVFTGFSTPRINTRGDVAFIGQVKPSVGSPAFPVWGLFTASTVNGAFILSKVVADGDPAPSPSGGVEGT